ncbi:MAG: type IX secretion system sortase PorU, partial [Paludibacter sp.]
FFSGLLFAQEIVFTAETTITWKGVETMSMGNSTTKLINFSNAVFPDETQLPYFNKRITAEPNYTYQVIIQQPVFENVSSEELQVLSSKSIANQSIISTTSILNLRGTSYLDILISPFVLNNGVIQKLKSFTLEVQKTAKTQKVKSNISHTYASNSVLASGKFIKIAVVNAGVYRLTYEDLNAMGINPANVRIFGYGGEVLDQNFANPILDDLPELAIQMEKGSDGVFNSGDYVLFYAKGIQKWSYDRTREMFIHTINSYATKGYYFVTSDAGVGKKIETKAITVPQGSPIVPVEEFTDYSVSENELINLANSGKEFYGQKFDERNTNSYVFNFPNIVQTNSTKVRLDVAGAASVVTSFTIDLDGAQQKSLQIPKRTDGDFYEKAKASNGFYTFTPTRDVLNLKLTYNQVVPTSIAYLNYIEVNAQRALKMSGAYMPFQYTGQLGTNNYCEYKLSDAGANVQIWDITEAHNISRVQTQVIDSKTTFTAPGIDLKNYLAIDPTIASSFPKPEIIGQVTNQNIHAMPQAEMIIITNPKFVVQAEELAQAHRTIDNLRVNIFTTDQVYNEFSSGTPDATAYRRAVKMFYDRALKSSTPVDLPKYLLLFGRGTFDNRKLQSSSGDNLILTYQADNSLVETLSYVTDDYFGFLDDNEGTQIPSHLLDVGIGRFPVTNTTDAENVVKKTIDYMKNTNMGKWKNQLCFLADDGDNALHMKQADSIANTISRNFKSYQVNKIYLDAYNQEISASGETYPVARKQLHDLIAKGLLYLNYTGHAGAQGWSNESVMTTNDVVSFTNKILPIWVGATCDFLQFDLKVVSAGEKVVLNPNGGGIGIFSAARPVYASQNFTVNKYFTENLFKKINGIHYRVGDAIALAKNSVGSEINKLSYIYMGDPALKLAFPTDYNVKTTTINNNTTFGTDTLKAMSVVNVTGEIIDSNNQSVPTFNGDLSMDVYDKLQRITTQNNHGDGNLVYSDRPNVLFSGKAAVKNGQFAFTFMLPKDIKYNYGGGRINYYASNTESEEAQGYFENFIVGGTNKNAVLETNGPEIKLYLNSENFKSGDKTNESPLLIAQLKDVSGINKVGSGIGHDLLITIDNEPMQSKVLNDYFETAANSYSEGSLRYKLNDLTEGKHTITFKAWDLLNNSASETIEFEVINGLQPVIFNVYNYQKEGEIVSHIKVLHDRPETILNTLIEIFDLSGRKIWHFTQNNADEIQWDFRGIDGIKVKSGVYFYKISISTNNSEVYSKSNKIFVLEK